MDQNMEEADTITTQFDGIISSISLFRNQLTDLQKQLRVLQRSVTKEVNTLKKESVKKKVKGNRKPSGFAKPTHITSELCSFMNLSENSEVARTEVTQYIIKYIREHNLQHSENRKIIVPNMALKQLLGCKDGDEVTYFNIQKYMNKHFIKTLDIVIIP